MKGRTRVGHLPGGDVREARLLRQPTASAEQTAFVYANDIWTAPKSGGKTRRLTTHIGTETNPAFSPDGKIIAFSGQYDGNTDVYIVPTEGGEPKRLTYHPYPDIVRGWTPDGKKSSLPQGKIQCPLLSTNRLDSSISTILPQEKPGNFMWKSQETSLD